MDVIIDAMTGIDFSLSANILILFGDSGLHQSTAHIWQNMAERFACLRVVPCALTGQKPGVLERRTRLVTDNVADLFTSIDIIDPAIAEQIRGASEAAAYVVGGRPGILVDNLAGQSYWRKVVSEADCVLAAGGAAAAFGTFMVARATELTGKPDLPSYALQPAADLIPASVVVPFYNWLPRETLSRLRSVCMPGLKVIGIESGTALVYSEQQWHVEGEGTVTILQSGSEDLRFTSGPLLL